MDRKRETTRLFVAIQVPGEVTARLMESQQQLKALLPREAVSWVRPDNLHLTLRFLGGVATDEIDHLRDELRSTLSSLPTLKVRCERLGCFPDLRYPRVVWTWVHDEHDGMVRLHEAVEKAAGDFSNEPSEKRFVGHVTLARIRRIKRPQAGIIRRFVEDQVDRVFGEWMVDRVSLMRSELRSEGAVYSEVERFDLKPET